MEYISCIKDGLTGECRDIKDKEARELIEELRNVVNSIAGLDGGHLATDEDINAINRSIDLINEAINGLDTSNFVTTGELEELQAQVTALKGIVDSLAGADTSHFATDEDIADLQSSITLLDQRVDGIVEDFTNDIESLQGQINNLDSTYATDEDINNIQENIIPELTEAIQDLQTRLDNLDNTYAKDEDIQGLQGQIDTANGNISALDNNLLTVNGNVTAVADRVTALEGASGGMSVKTIVPESISELFTQAINLIKSGKFLYMEVKNNASSTSSSNYKLTMASYKFHNKDGITYSSTTSSFLDGATTTNFKLQLYNDSKFAVVDGKGRSITVTNSLFMIAYEYFGPGNNDSSGNAYITYYSNKGDSSKVTDIGVNNIYTVTVYYLE